MDGAPHDFIMNHSERDLERFEGFVHRTFNAVDTMTFVTALRPIYQNGGLEGVFSAADHVKSGLEHLHQRFFSIPHLDRTRKHMANPAKGSAAKRLNMFLRWMVRQDKSGVDFGLWRSVDPAKLMLPLDVHTANVGRKLGLLDRKQNDWKAVEEITAQLRTFDPADPVKYDFALFGLGVFEHY